MFLSLPEGEKVIYIWISGTNTSVRFFYFFEGGACRDYLTRKRLCTSSKRMKSAVISGPRNLPCGIVQNTLWCVGAFFPGCRDGEQKHRAVIQSSKRSLKQSRRPNQRSQWRERVPALALRFEKQSRACQLTREQSRLGRATRKGAFSPWIGTFA